MKKLLLFTALFFVFFSVEAQIKIRKGKSQTAVVLYNWDGRVLREGASKKGEPILNYDGKTLREGGAKTGEIISTFDGKIIDGDGYYLKFDGLNISSLGKIFYTWNGRLIRKGDSEYGDVILNTSGDVPVPVVVFLALILDR